MRARARAKSDANQPDIIKDLRKLGATVQDVHSIAGALDIIIGYRGIDQRAEIKDPIQDPNKRRLTPAEKNVFDTWAGRKPVILETIDDCRALLAEMARDSAKYTPSCRDQDLGAPNTGQEKSR